MNQDERMAEYDRLRQDGAREAAEYLRERQAEARRDYLTKAYGHAGIPPRFRGQRFDAYQAETDDQRYALDVAQRYAHNFRAALARGVCLTLIGRPGTGKTHLAAAIGETLIENGHPVLFRSLSGLLRDFRMSYRDGGPSEAEVLRRMVEPDLLIVDEIGISIGNLEKTQATLMEVFNSRYEENRPTLLLGNVTRQELRDFLGERIERRVQEGGGPVVAFTWEPYVQAQF